MVTHKSKATRAKILAAATQAFVALGPAGARVDAIAAAAGVNKRMLYHHFGDKQGLYQAVLAASLDEGGQLSKARARLLAWQGLTQVPDEFGPGLAASIPGEENLGGTPDETLGESVGPLIEPTSPTSRKSKVGLSNASLDTQMFALLQMALQVFPHVCGPEVERLTGLAVDSEAFAAALGRLQQQLEQQVDPRAQAQTPKAKVTLRPRSLPRVRG